jgi:type II secretory pathway pseudopilin PulG
MNLKLKENGFSLVEVLIAAGILGAVSVGVMQLTKNMQQGQKTVELKGEKMDFSNRMKLYLSSDKSCEATLGGISTNSNTVVNQIKIYRENPNPAELIVLDLTNADAKAGAYEFGEGAAKIKVTGITVQNYNKIQDTDASTEEGTLDLVFQMEKASTNKQGTLGASSFTERMPLQVYVDKTTKAIKTCTDPSGGAKAACDALGGTMQMTAAGTIGCMSLQLNDNNVTNAVEVTNPADESSLKINSNQMSLSDPDNGTAMHVRSWGLSTDIESMNGPLVFNNKTVNQKVWKKDAVTGDIVETTEPVDGRVQIGAYRPNDTNTLYVGGTIYAAGNISTDTKVFASGVELTSDIRLKSKVTALKFHKQDLLSLSTYSYVYRNGDGDRHTGFIAQEVQEKFPQLVGMRSDGYLTVKSLEMIPYLLELIKQQEKRIEKLESALNQNK